MVSADYMCDAGVPTRLLLQYGNSPPPGGFYISGRETAI